MRTRPLTLPYSTRHLIITSHIRRSVTNDLALGLGDDQLDAARLREASLMQRFARQLEELAETFMLGQLPHQTQHSIDVSGFTAADAHSHDHPHRLRFARSVSYFS